MKTKDLKNLRSKSVADLVKTVDAKKKDLLKLQISLSTGGEKNLKSVKNLKKEIAQILTIIREKEIVEKESEDSKHKSDSKK